MNRYTGFPLLNGSVAHFIAVLDHKALTAATGADNPGGVHVPAHRPCPICYLTKHDLHSGWREHPFHFWNIERRTGIEWVLPSLDVFDYRYCAMHGMQNMFMDAVRCIGASLPRGHSARKELTDIFARLPKVSHVG